MSTRSIIAVPDKDHVWKGVYHHSDGYPVGIGVYLSRVLAAMDHDINLFRKLVIEDHPVGWSHLYPSTYTLQGEHLEEPGICECYCHSRGETGDNWMYGDQPINMGGCEWLYLVTPDGIIVREIKDGGMFVTTKRKKKLPDPMGPEMSLTEAVEFDLKHNWSEEAGEQMLEGFRNRKAWAFQVELPAFVTALVLA